MRVSATAERGAGEEEQWAIFILQGKHSQISVQRCAAAGGTFLVAQQLCSAGRLRQSSYGDEAQVGSDGRRRRRRRDAAAAAS